MATKREIVEAVLFLPAMALLAGAVFGAFWLIIKFGNAVLHGWYWLLGQVGIPHPAALALGVLLSAATVPLALKLLFIRPRRQ